MGRPKRPYMKCWTVDWENDPEWRAMGAEDRGVYFSLVLFNWNHGGFDLSSVEGRSKLEAGTGLKMRRVNASWTRIRSRFDLDENGRFFNRRALRELGALESDSRRKVKFHPISGEDTDTESDSDTESDEEVAPSDRKPIAAEPPPELFELELYRADEKLCRLWPEVFPAWKAAFPAVDVIAIVRQAHAWEVANPDRRKKNRSAYLQRWLSKAQDNPPLFARAAAANNNQAPRKPTSVAGLVEWYRKHPEELKEQS